MRTHPIIIENLEEVVQERTPHYISLTHPKYDEELLKAHCLLALFYAKEGSTLKSHNHFSLAEHEFRNMCHVEGGKPEYIMGGKDGYRQQKRKIEKHLQHTKDKLLAVAGKIGYTPFDLYFMPIRFEKKESLAEMIKDEY